MVISSELGWITAEEGVDEGEILVDFRFCDTHVSSGEDAHVLLCALS